MIDQPSIEADTEHDIVRKQRMPLSVEAQKLAMWGDLVEALGQSTKVLTALGYDNAIPSFAYRVLLSARAIK